MAEVDQASSLDLREDSSESVVIVDDDEEMKSLEAFIKKLTAGSNANSSGNAELSAKLEVVRIRSADQKKRAQKAAWIAETQKEVAKRAQFRNSNISDLLPELVGKQILEHVEDSKDKAMLSKMCLVWRDALKKERTSFLFHGVFPKLNLSEQDRTCRLVCREWNKSIQHCIQIPIDVAPMGVSFLDVYSLRGIEERFNVGMMHLVFPVDFIRVTSFIEWSKRSYPFDGNPFFSWIRFGCFCPHDPLNNSLFWRQAERLLERWGRKVLMLDFNFSKPKTLESDEVYEVVCKLLRLTPNLRYLSFFSRDHMNDSDKLKACIEQFPLPELVHLHTVVSKFIPPALLKSVLTKYGPTLKYVFASASGKFCYKCAFGDTRLPNLKQFAFMSIKQCFPGDFEYQADWPSIEEMDFHFKNFSPVGIPDLFQGINDFGRKLRKLNVKLEEIRGQGEPMELDAAATKKLLLELPNLESFSLAMAFVKGNLKTIDFILPMVSLKDLSLCYVRSFKSRPAVEKCKSTKGPKRKADAGPSDSTKANTASDGEEFGDIIKFWKYAGRLYESNIWRLLPELRKVTITTVKKLEYPDKDRKNVDGNVKEKVYTREGYRQYVMQRN